MTVTTCNDLLPMSRRQSREEMLYPYKFFMPAFMLIVLVSFLPLVFAIVQSFFKSDYLQLGRFAGFSNYYDYLVGRNGLRSIWNSIAFVSLTTVIAMPLGFGLALILNKPLPFRGTIRTILILPWLVSNLIAGLLWAWMINPKYGLAVHLLRQIGLEMPNIITNEYAAMAGVALAMAWAEYPVVMVFVLGALQTVPTELYEAAQMDGVSSWQRFRYVTFPMVRNTTMVTLILTALHAFKNVEVILVITGGGPGAATETMALRVFQEGFQFFRMGVASSGAIIIFMMNILFTLAFIRVLRTEYGA